MWPTLSPLSAQWQARAEKGERNNPVSKEYNSFVPTNKLTEFKFSVGADCPIAIQFRYFNINSLNQNNYETKVFIPE
jgi:hypothetical protein